MLRASGFYFDKADNKKSCKKIYFDSDGHYFYKDGKKCYFDSDGHYFYKDGKDIFLVSSGLQRHESHGRVFDDDDYYPLENDYEGFGDSDDDFDDKDEDPPPPDSEKRLEKMIRKSKIEGNLWLARRLERQLAGSAGANVGGSDDDSPDPALPDPALPDPALPDPPPPAEKEEKKKARQSPVEPPAVEPPSASEEGGSDNGASVAGSAGGAGKLTDQILQDFPINWTAALSRIQLQGRPGDCQEGASGQAARREPAAPAAPAAGRRAAQVGWNRETRRHRIGRV